MVYTSCKNLYNGLYHSRVINWRLGQIVLVRWSELGGEGWLLIFGKSNVSDMQSLHMLDFQRFGYKNTKKLHFLVIPRGRNLITKTGLMIGHFNSFLDQRWGNLNTKFSKIPDMPDLLIDTLAC